MEGAGKRRQRVKIKSKSPIDLPRKIKPDEMTKLLNCIKENGHKDFNKLQECLPKRTLGNIKTFLRTVYDNAAKLSEGHPNLDAWIKLAVGKSRYEAAWRDTLQIAQVIKYLSVDGLLENHPLPESSQGINFPEAYRLLYQALMGYPIQPVNQETLKFVKDTVLELTTEVKKEKDVINSVRSFLIEILKPVEVNETVPSTCDVKNEKLVAESTSCSNTNGAMQVKKPLRVYKRKKPNPDTETPPSLTIVVEASDNKSKENSLDMVKDYSVTISGRDSQETVVNIPVPVRINQTREVDPEEEQLLQSTSYNPFKIPKSWLEEPVFVNMRRKQ